MQNNFWAFLVLSNGKDFLNNTKLFFIPMIWGLIFKIHVCFSAAHRDSTDTPTLVAQAHHSLLLYQRKRDTGDGHRCELDPPGRSLLWSPTRACGRKGTAGRRESRGEGSWVWTERTNKRVKEGHRAGDNTRLWVLILVVWCFELQKSILHIITDNRRWRVAYFSEAVAGRSLDNWQSHVEGKKMFLL